ncbi:Mediator of RNA polymerase II transcription subunit 7 [Saitoella coloradoensis]
MAEQGQGSAFPDPPGFYKLFTAENVAAAQDAPEGTTGGTVLQFLKPPEPPKEGYITVFGVDRSIEHQELPPLVEVVNPMTGRILWPDGLQLFPEGEVDRVTELRKLTKSMLLNYLEIVTIMGDNPNEWFPKLLDLKRIVHNIHYLLNGYRPHQARETLCLMMEEQIRRKKEEMKKIREKCRETETLISQFARNGVTKDGHDMEDKAEGATLAEEASSDAVKWSAIEGI